MSAALLFLLVAQAAHAAVALAVGQMVKAMAAQKRDLARRLKGAEGSNRQLRAELQEFRAGYRWGSHPSPATCQPPSAAGGPAGGLSGETYQ